MDLDVPPCPWRWHTGGVDVEGLIIPERLVAMLAAGRWPSDAQAERHQHLVSAAAPDRIRAVTGDESHLYLYRPPFITVASARAGNPGFWTGSVGALADLDPQRSVLIADFGMGADAPIALDYRADPVRPSVRRLKWGPRVRPEHGGPMEPANRWVLVASTFDEFVELFGLDGDLGL